MVRASLLTSFSVALNGADLFLNLVHEATEFFEFQLRRGKQLPNLATLLLDRQGAESHLQAREQSSEGGRPGEADTVGRLQVVDQPRARGQ
jgi:hypothetical protein